MKDRKKNRSCNGSSPNLNFMTFGLYAAVSSLDVGFAKFFIGSWKWVLLRRFIIIIYTSSSFRILVV